MTSNTDARAHRMERTMRMSAITRRGFLFSGAAFGVGLPAACTAPQPAREPRSAPHESMATFSGQGSSTRKTTSARSTAVPPAMRRHCGAASGPTSRRVCRMGERRIRLRP